MVYRWVELQTIIKHDIQVGRTITNNVTWWVEQVCRTTANNVTWYTGWSNYNQ